MSCIAHSSCNVGEYCDAGNFCYMCSFIDPTTCDAFDSDCCSPEFLTQCTTNPANCPPPPPPAPGPDPGDDAEEAKTLGWTISILILVSSGLYVVGGIGYARYVGRDSKVYDDESCQNSSGMGIGMLGV